MVHTVHVAPDNNGALWWSCCIQKMLPIKSLCYVHRCFWDFGLQKVKFVHASDIVVITNMIKLLGDRFDRFFSKRNNSLCQCTMTRDRMKTKMGTLFNALCVTCTCLFLFKIIYFQFINATCRFECWQSHLCLQHTQKVSLCYKIGE